MKTFELLFAHNAWASRQVLDACKAAPNGLLQAPGEGITSDSHLERLRHLFEVERGFLGVLRGESTRPPKPAQELDGLVSYHDGTAAGFEQLVAVLDEAALDGSFYVPWWEREFEVRDGLLQVIAHSSQHRAEVAWALSKVGVSTGDLDHISWTAAGRPASGTNPRLG